MIVMNVNEWIHRLIDGLGIRFKLLVTSPDIYVTVW